MTPNPASPRKGWPTISPNPPFWKQKIPGRSRWVFSSALRKWCIGAS